MSLRLRSTYGQTSRGAYRGASSDVGKVPLTRAQRLANMRASASRYQGQAAAQRAAGYVAPTFSQRMNAGAAAARASRQKYEADQAAAARKRKRVPWYKQVSRGIKKYSATALQAAATGASFVPGVGSAVAAGLGGAAALAAGKSFSEIGQAAALASLPGGAVAQMAVGTASRLASGQRIDRALVAEGIKALPGGPIAGAAARTGLAIAQGKRVDRAVLANAKNLASTAARGAMPDMRITAPLRSPDPLRNGRLGPIGRPPGFGPIGPRLARMAIERTPVLATQTANQLGRSLGISTASASQALGSARALRWRPLRGTAPAFVTRLASGFPTRFLSRRDASGLAPDGATWTIDKGNTLSAIAQKLTGDASRWREFLPANPNVKRHPSWGLEVYPGDVLVIPAAWRPESTPPPSQVTAAQVLASKAILKAWSVTDGQDQPGLTDYGTRPEDLSASWGARDRLMLTAFSQWRGNLPTGGDLEQVHCDALAAWAEQRAGVPPIAILPAPAQPAPSLPTPSLPTPSLPTPSLPTPAPAETNRLPLPVPERSNPALPALPAPPDWTPPPPPPAARPTTAAAKPGGAGMFATALAVAALLL